MPALPVVRITRPHDSEAAFLTADAWTVERSSMVLIGPVQAPLGSLVRFEIALATGSVLVAGEGKLVEPVAAAGDRPAGTRLRLQKLDGASKGVLRRALEAQRVQKPEPTKIEPPPPSSGAAQSERSGVRNNMAAYVVDSSTRETLLDRLRERNRRRTASG